MFHDIIKKIPARDYGIDGLEVHVDYRQRLVHFHGERRN